MALSIGHSAPRTPLIIATQNAQVRVASARGEALGLRWSNIDLDTGRAQINQTVIAIGWNVHFGQPKTQAGRRPIALDPSTVEVLREHQRAMLAQPVAGAGRGGDLLVFCSPDGAPLHPERVYQAFRRAVIRHHLPSIPLHGLRHTWATLALQMDVHPRVVQERLGHSNIAITLQTLFARAADHARRRRRRDRRCAVHARVLMVSIPRWADIVVCEEVHVQ